MSKQHWQDQEINRKTQPSSLPLVKETSRARQEVSWSKRLEYVIVRGLNPAPQSRELWAWGWESMGNDQHRSDMFFSVFLFKISPVASMMPFNILYSHSLHFTVIFLPVILAPSLRQDDHTYKVRRLLIHTTSVNGHNLIWIFLLQFFPWFWQIALNTEVEPLPQPSKRLS